MYLIQEPYNPLVHSTLRAIFYIKTNKICVWGVSSSVRKSYKLLLVATLFLGLDHSRNGEQCSSSSVPCTACIGISWHVFQIAYSPGLPLLLLIHALCRWEFAFKVTQVAKPDIWLNDMPIFSCENF